MTTPPHLRALRVWQRIHVRLTVVYGAALLAVLVPLAYLVHVNAVDAEIQNLRTWIRGMVVSLASAIDGDAFDAIETADAPYRVELERRARVVMADSPLIASVFALEPTANAAEMRFVLDTDIRKQPAAFKEVYEITRYAELRAGVTQPIVGSVPVEDDWGISISGFAPVRNGAGAIVGVIGIDVDAREVDAIRAAVLRLTVAILAGALILLAVAGVAVGRMLRRPMAQIIGGTEAIAAGRFDTRVGVGRNDEFGVLGGHFDMMAAGLEERDFIRSMFGRYVSEDVARKLLEERRNGLLKGEERRVTILFSDVANYTTVSEHLGPSLVLGLMNQYIEAMNEVVAAHGGCVLEYIGDGILAVFNAPEDLPHHEEQAVRSAVAMQQRLLELNRKWDADGTSEAWKKHGLPALAIRIGIHTGPVVAGSLGSEIRMKYTIMGDSVNVAARIEALNKELRTGILLSDDTYAGLDADTRARAVDLGAHRVKGREKAVAVFTVPTA